MNAPVLSGLICMCIICCVVWQRYSDLKMSLINAEQTVLRVLGFEVDVAMPFNFLFSYAHQNRYVKTYQAVLNLCKLG